jgi:hypothetical protein
MGRRGFPTPQNNWQRQYICLSCRSNPKKGKIMGWLYKSSLDGFKTPTEYLDHQFTFDRRERSFRVLRSALVQMRRYYAAVERVEKASGERSVSAVVCLVAYNQRDKEGYIFGYKDMDETMGPCEHDCPAFILDLLTPIDSKWANDWRQACRVRLAKVRPRAGQVLVLAEPLRFTDGAVLSRLHAVERRIRNRKRLAFRGDNGVFYHIRNLRDLHYTIEEPAEGRPHPAATAPAQSLLF